MCVFSMECTDSERAAATKRDVVKAKVDEMNEKLLQLNENKKEKMKDVKKTRKYASQRSRCNSQCHVCCLLHSQ